MPCGLLLPLGLCKCRHLRSGDVLRCLGRGVLQLPRRPVPERGRLFGLQGLHGGELLTFWRCCTHRLPRRLLLPCRVRKCRHLRSGDVLGCLGRGVLQLPRRTVPEHGRLFWLQGLPCGAFTTYHSPTSAPSRVASRCELSLSGALYRQLANITKTSFRATTALPDPRPTPLAPAGTTALPALPDTRRAPRDVTRLGVSG